MVTYLEDTKHALIWYNKNVENIDKLLDLK